MTRYRHPASLRDPAGYLVKLGNRLLRVIKPEFVREYSSIITTPWLQEQCQAGLITSFRILEMNEALELVGSEAYNGLCLEHDLISFPSYPSEWPLEMLCKASELTINLCMQALQNGTGLKDATPFNILFKGASPVFVDILSFETRDKHDPTWLAHGQFVRSFLLPSLLDSRRGIPCHTTFLANRDGIEPEDVYRLLSPLERVAPPFFGNVTMPVLLAARAMKQSGKLYDPKRVSNPDKAKFILETVFSNLLDTVRSSATRRQKNKTWINYNETCTYTPTDTGRKSDFIEQFMKENEPARVLDVGCNTGQFSFLAAKYAAEVVAIDLDPEVVGNLWQRAADEKANILPLVMNLARPTPALGWRNLETLSFLQRAEGYFDALFMLAVIHHMLITDQIPFEEIISQASRLTTKWLVIEYIGPDDPQFKRLMRGRSSIYGEFNQNTFEIELAKFFEVIRSEKIPENGRWLYLARRKNAN